MFERSIYLAGEGIAPLPTLPDPQAESAARELTRRELEILRLVAEGYSNSQLAKMLWVTEQTVKFHLSNIYRKLDVANRTEASRWAQVHGLLPAQREAAARELARTYKPEFRPVDGKSVASLRTLLIAQALRNSQEK